MPSPKICFIRDIIPLSSQVNSMALGIIIIPIIPDMKVPDIIWTRKKLNGGISKVGLKNNWFEYFMVVNNNVSAYQWYPVYTNSRAEKKALEALTKKGIMAYLPLHRQLKTWSDRKKWVEEPLLSSYLFVYIPTAGQTEVLMTKGISRFIYFSGKIATMPEKQIEDLKLVMASAYELEITEKDLQPGEKIVIKAGPLKGMVGEIISYRSQKQLVLKLEALGRSIIINAAASLIIRF
jgi:transcriptional antiterminator RfaH